MSNDMVARLNDNAQSLRYPILANLSDAPHRFVVQIEYLRQTFKILIFTSFLEAFMLICMPGSNVFLIAMGICAFVLCIGLNVALRNTRLTLSDDAISFPLLMAHKLQGRVKRSWNDVARVDLHVGKNGFNFVRGNVLSMSFKSGGQIDLEISRMSHKDITLLSEKLNLMTDEGVLAPAVAEIISRNEFELSNTRGFVFSKEHRTLLDQNLGLANEEPHAAGSALFDGLYIIDKLISVGGNRAQYLVYDVQRGQTLKMCEYSLAMLDDGKKEDCFKALIDGAQPYLNLKIPHLFNLVDVRASTSSFCAFYEPDGKTLRAAVNKKIFDDKTTLALALKLAQAVFQTTNLGLPLGGIKPDTITYSPDGTTMVGEFGFVEDQISSYSNQVMQDAPYTAPESLAGNPAPCSDLYAIGAVMYFALTGHDPTCFSSSSARLANSKVSESTDLLISKLLSVQPEARGSVTELIYSLGGTAIYRIAANSND